MQLSNSPSGRDAMGEGARTHESHNRSVSGLDSAIDKKMNSMFKK